MRRGGEASSHPICWPSPQPAIAGRGQLRNPFGFGCLLLVAYIYIGNIIAGTACNCRFRTTIGLAKRQLLPLMVVDMHLVSICHYYKY